MYRPGELDEKISIYKEMSVSDGMGGKEISLAPVAVGLWCKVRPLTGNEAVKFDRVQAVESTAFIIRYRSDVKESYRIKWNGEEYNIRRIPGKSKRSMYLELYADTGAGI